MASREVSYINSDLNTVSLTKRKKAVEFRVGGLRPKSNTMVYINNTEVTEFVLPCDIIQIEFSANNISYPGRSRRSDWRWQFQNGEGFIIIDSSLPGGTGKKSIAHGRIEYIEQVSVNTTSNVGIANVHLFIEGPGEDTLYNKKDTERVITSNTTFIISKESGGIANNKIIAFYPKYSLVNVATSNTIQLTGKVANSEISNTVTIGTKIYIVSGEGAGQNATVQSYDSTTRTITIAGEWDLVPGAVSNNSISPDDRAMVRFGKLNSDSTGSMGGMIMVPSILEQDVIENFSYGWRYYARWNGWHKRFKIFHSGNKLTFKNDDFTETTVEKPDETPGKKDPIVIVDPSPTPDPITPTPTLSSTYSSTPFAQTFYIDPALHPQGVYLLSCKLLFNAKDNDYPVQVQIRPTIAGIPDATRIMPNGDAFIQPYDINVLSETTLKELNVAGTNPFSSNTHYSEAFFEKPVYLEGGKDYAIVVMTPSPNHKIYISQIGEKLFGTDRIVSAQPYLGVLYKTQGTSTWTASPNEDLCFELTKAVYSVSSPAVVDLYLKSIPTDLDNYGIQGIVDLEQTAPEGTINLHAFYVTNPEVPLANTSVSYQYRTTRYDGTKDSFKNFELDQTYELYDTFGTRVLTPSNNSFTVRATLSTNNPDVAPTLDFSDMTLLRIENLIDNNTIANDDIFITNSGQDYSNAKNVVVTITGGGGSGATAVANVVNGTVDAIYITNGGSGYTGSPTINISSDTTSTITAEAVIIGEDQPNGGVADAKYITKRFTLTEGFSGGDLRVIFSAYKPQESIIDVYYKIMSEDDFDNFENKRWTLMTVIGGINDNSLNRNDFKNYIYAPGKGNKADNFISYDGFTTFKYFAIKIVMRSIDGTKVPVIKDLRVTALAELLT